MAECERIQFSAKFDGFIGGQPSDASVLQIRDVIVCATDATVEANHDEFRAHPPIASPILRRLYGSAEPVELGRGIRIDRLSKEDSELVMNACSPRGHYFSPIRQFGQRYSFIRNVDPDEWKDHPYRWDPEGVLWDALTLSRLVRDNAYSTQYAARLTDFEDGEQSVVYTLTAESQFAYRLRRDREWLDAAEGTELRRLLASYWVASDTMPARVRRAMWRAEYASWIKWGDLIVPTLVSGLEALIKTDRHGLTRQFVQRVPALAEELGIKGMSHQVCDQLYDARSDWVHGAHVQLFTTGRESQERQETAAQQGPGSAEQRAIFAEIARLQDVLRNAVRRCVEDEEFRMTFADDDAIRARWPVTSA